MGFQYVLPKRAAFRRLQRRVLGAFRKRGMIQGFLTTLFILSLLKALSFSFLSGKAGNTFVQTLRNSRTSGISLEPSFRYVLSACVISRRSSELMPEFVIRNYAAGVDHFYVYGDDDDDPEEVMRMHQIFRWLDGIVTYIPHGRAAPKDREDPKSYVQMRMYRHCLRKFGSDSKWMTFIDTDEFFETHALPQIEIKPSDRDRRAFVHDILSKYESLPVLCVRWKSALTNGRILPPKPGEFLHDLFPRTCKILVGDNGHLSARKTIMQTRYVDLDQSPKYDEGIHKGFVFRGPGLRTNVTCKAHLGKNLEPPIHIVHYWSRDLSSFLRKIRRGRPRKTVPTRTLYDLYEREKMCEAEDVRSSADIRHEHVSTLLRSFPVSFRSSVDPASPEMALGIGKGSHPNTTLCENHVRKLVQKISEGRDFSNVRYCEHRLSQACEGFTTSNVLRWPFPWAEYLSNCTTEINEDMFFL